MKIVSNEKLIKRNARIGQITSLLSLGVLGAGMYVSFTMPEQFNLAIGALLVGFLLSQVGIYFGNRWGRSPRPDEQLDRGLKGLPGDYTLYHYSTPVANLLVGPAGIWVLMPYHQRGRISYDGKRWRVKGGGFAQSYMRLFGQESVGRPDLEAGAEIDKLKRHLSKQMPGQEIPPIQAALVFTDENADIQAEDAPVPTMPLKKLKPFIRKQAKEAPLPAKEIKRINAVFENA